MSKKDPNYLAAVEKAIAEQYGKVAAQDFRSTWDPQREREYLRQLKKRNKAQHKSAVKKEKIELGETIITKPQRHAHGNRSCPVCKTYSFSPKDDLYMNRFESCHRCYIDFVEHREDRWNKGWKPTEEQVMTALTRRKKQWLIS